MIRKYTGMKDQGTDFAPWGFRSPGTVRNRYNGLRKSGVSLRDLCLGNKEEGSFVRGYKVCERKNWGWASLFMGAQLGNLECAYLTGTLKYG